jgi:hypothetical protein
LKHEAWSFFYWGSGVLCADPTQYLHSDKRRAPLGGCCLVSSPNFRLAAHWLSLDQRVLECERNFQTPSSVHKCLAPLSITTSLSLLDGVLFLHCRPQFYFFTVPLSHSTASSFPPTHKYHFFHLTRCPFVSHHITLLASSIPPTLRPRKL